MDDAPTSSASEQNPQQFALSAIIQAHNDDSKCVVESSPRTLISGGRDGFMKIWTNENGTWENSSTIQQKDCLTINSIAFGALNTSGWECLIFVGRKNGSIAIYSPANPADPIKVMQGHKSNVCALHFDEKLGFLMSGSWDHVAVVWPIEQLLLEDGSDVAIGFLAGHNCSVWAVATVPSKPTKFLTGSADKTIKIWSHKYEEIDAFHGHTDVVRAIVVISELHFLSTANDATIILWDIQAKAKMRTFLPQHENFIYTLARLNFDHETDLIISGGEGGCIDIWKLKADATLEHRQAMKVPVESVWSVAPMSNGDFATATSSGLVLVFSTDPGKKAPDDLQEFFYSSQYEELADKERKTQSAKDSSFDMNRFSAEKAGTAQTGENGLFRRVVGAEFGTPAYQDPFTGTGRYVPGSAPQAAAPTNTDKKRPRNHLVPLEQFYTFGLNGLSSKVTTRLRDLNLKQPKTLRLTEDEICSIEPILSQSEFEISECQVIAFEKGLQWPVEDIVPTLDIFRLSLLHPMINEIFCSLKPVFGNPPKGRATMQRLLELLNSEESPEPVRILACRSLTNAAKHEFGREMLQTEILAFCNSVSQQLCSTKPSLQIASASALANFAGILLLKTGSDQKVTELGPREDALRSMISAVRRVRDFGSHSPVAILRLLQATITLMWGQSAVIYLAMELEFAAILNQIKDAMGEEDVKMLIRDAVGMIQAI